MRGSEHWVDSQSELIAKVCIFTPKLILKLAEPWLCKLRIRCRSTCMHVCWHVHNIYLSKVQIPTQIPPSFGAIFRRARACIYHYFEDTCFCVCNFVHDYMHIECFFGICVILNLLDMSVASACICTCCNFVYMFGRNLIRGHDQCVNTSCMSLHNYSQTYAHTNIY